MFATHLLFGTYLLGSLALPALAASEDGRLVAVSSGGMYNTNFPRWDIATSIGANPYDGQFVYAYAKRGQVLLCEQWAAQSGPRVKVVSCHPGWTQTEAVDAAYGESKKYLEPLRTTWQGAEGIIWLLVAPSSEVVSGSFYLDRSPQTKHLAGPFFTEGSYTKNSEAEVAEMMRLLSLWSDARLRPSEVDQANMVARAFPLKASDQPFDLAAFMGRWHVLANIPSVLEVGAYNCIENYAWDESKQVINVVFDYVAKGYTSASSAQMRAKVLNSPTNTHWAISPKIGVYLPLNLDYLVIDLAPDGSYTTIGVPDRSYLWIMIRKVPTIFHVDGIKVGDAYDIPGVAKSSETTEAIWEAIDAEEQDILRTAVTRAVVLGYDASKILRVPWKDICSNPPSSV